MKTNSHIWCIGCVLLAFPAWAQTISHLQQMPMYVNPGLVADQGVSKIAAFYSSEKSSLYPETGTEQTGALCYEGLWKNLAFGTMLMGVQNQQKAGNRYTHLKVCVAYMFKFTRKEGTRPYAFVPALDYTVSASNNTVYSDTYQYSNGVVRTSINLHSANDIFIWPKRGKDLTFGLAYRSEKTQVAISGAYSWQNIGQQNTYWLSNVPYKYKSIDPVRQAEERNTVEAQSTDIRSKNAYAWNQLAISLFFSQRVDFGIQKNFSLTCFTWYTEAVRNNLPQYLSENFYDQDGYIDIGAISRYKHLLFGLQVGNRLSDFLVVGHQTDQYILMASFGGYKNQQLSGSLSLNYYLKKRDEK